MATNNGHRKVYFIGIGGIGMSALARWFRSQKWAVSGSDITPSRITKELRKEGIKVNFGHKKGHVKADLGSTGSPQVTLVIRSLAVKPDNPEFLAASRLGLPVITYPEAVGVLTESHKTIAVAGAHGKSTTTALIGLILKKAGLDPTIVVGTELKEFGGKNFRLGHSHRHGYGGYLVLEADEFGKAFLHYSPTLAIVTNIDNEHLDTYKNLGGVKKAFLEFLARTRPGGALILNKDSGPLFSMKARIKKIARQKNLRVIWYSLSLTTIIPQLWYNRSESGAAQKVVATLKKILKIPGEHNVSNALAAYAAAKILGISKNKIISAIAAYHGSWRRFEYRGQLKAKSSKLKAKVYDDYAHHPTEIEATLTAFREKFPESKIICVFQPHQTERLRLLFKDFTSAFDAADVLILLPTYQVAGREGVTRHASSIKLSKKLAAAIQKKHPGKPVFYLTNPRKLKQFIITILCRSAFVPRSSAVLGHNLRKSASYQRTSAVLVMMGAGDIVNYTDQLLT